MLTPEQQLQQEQQRRQEAEQRLTDMEELRRQINELRSSQQEQAASLIHEKQRADAAVEQNKKTAAEHEKATQAAIEAALAREREAQAATRRNVEQNSEINMSIDQQETENERNDVQAERSLIQSVPFSVALGSVPKYDPEDTTLTVQAWIEQIDEEALIYGWSPIEKYLAAKRSLAGAANRWISSQRGIHTWEDLKSGLKEAFGTRVTAADIHDSLRKRRRKKDESILRYVQEMEFIASQGEISESDIRQYIINGVTANMQSRLTLRTARSRSELVELLESFDKELKEQEKFKNRFTRRTCYNCHKQGHLSKDCPEKKDENNSSEEKEFKKEVTCFYCKQTGHIIPDCPKKKASANRRAPNANNVAHGLKNRSRVQAVIGNVKVECQVDSGADKHLMRNDIFKKVNSDNAYDLIEPGVIMNGAGGLIHTLGSVIVPTEINKTIYDFCYYIAPEESLPTAVLLGDPILDVADVNLRREGPVIRPLSLSHRTRLHTTGSERGRR